MGETTTYALVFVSATRYGCLGSVWGWRMNLADLGITPEFLDKSAHPNLDDPEVRRREYKRLEETRKRLEPHRPYFLKCCREHGGYFGDPETEANAMFNILCVIDMAVEDATASTSNPPA